MRRPLLASLALVLAACTHAAGSGGTCVLNSDCMEPFVCAGTFCRAQCRLDRDCATGETCRLNGSGNVCVPPGAAIPCTLPSDCGSDATCVMQTCRAICTTDATCAPGTCVSGACSDPVQADGDASVPDGGGDAGTDAGPGCADETVLVPTMRTFQFTYSAPATTPPGPTCSPGARHRYFRVHVAERELVIVYAPGVAGTDMMGWLSPDCGTTTACTGTCGPDMEMAAVLDPGDYPFVIESASLSANVSIVTVPIPTGIPAEQITDNPFIVDASLGTAPAAPANACGAVGPAHVWWTEVCLTTDAHTLDVSSCGSSPNVDLLLYADTTGTSSSCGADDTSCTPSGRAAHQALRLAGPTVVVIGAAGHGPSDTGTVHLVGSAT